ncbi:MAG: hypothetical protein K2Y21_12115 [Phycisphaerales bacterium]|nr:hypothetical protein [Phycisphaerales bacterium]
MKITACSQRRFSFSSGIALIAVMPSAHRTTESRYHVFRVSVVSTIGAHRNFHTCGNMPDAISSAPSSTLRWCRVHRNAIATLTYPLIAPNGMMSTANAAGWGGRGVVGNAVGGGTGAGVGPDIASV